MVLNEKISSLSFDNIKFNKNDFLNNFDMESGFLTSVLCMNLCNFNRIRFSLTGKYRFHSI